MTNGINYDKETGIYTNQKKTPPIPNDSVYDFLMQNRDYDAAQPAFVEHKLETLKDGTQHDRTRSITHGQLKLQAQRLGHGLVVRAGLQPGDMVMLLGTNSIEWVVVMLAAQFAGLRVALASPAYATKELKHIYRLANPKRVFIPTTLLIKVTRAQIPWASVISYDVDAGMPEIAFTRKIMSPESEAIHATPAKIQDLADTAAFLPFSSGTTGLPKGVEITHRNVVAMLSIISSAADIYSRPTRLLNCLPFFHAMALLIHVCISIRMQSTVHIQVPFNADFFIHLLEKEKIEQTSVVPPILLLFGQSDKANRQSFRHVQYLGCGAAPLAVETHERIANKLGCPIVQGYGLSESTVGVLGLDFGAAPGTCGKVLPGIEAKVVDPATGRIVSPGSRGELWFRGPNIMKGYYRNPDATREAITSDGWLKTGDVAVVTQDGDFRIVDRIKELIKYKGNQVAPAELEALILTHPKVASAGVVGIYDEAQATELPRAYIQLRPGSDAKGIEAEVQTFVRQRAGNAKWLRGGVRIVEQLPVTPSGKILRKELRLLVQSEASTTPRSRL